MSVALSVFFAHYNTHEPLLQSEEFSPAQVISLKSAVSAADFRLCDWIFPFVRDFNVKERRETEPGRNYQI